MTLLEAVVRSELRAFADRADSASQPRPLTEGEVLQALTSGKVETGAPDHVDATPLPAVEDLMETLRVAHRDGLFEMIVDDKRVDFS